ncbi:hypothetical protein [Tardiphaga sp. 839_C3_N1_4]
MSTNNHTPAEAKAISTGLLIWCFAAMLIGLGLYWAFGPGS